MTKPYLIVLSGLPGVGKTTLARDLACALGAVYLRIDAIEKGLQASALPFDDVMDAGYHAAWQIAQENLELQLSVVGDSVNPVPATRNGWRHVAARSDADLVEIEVVCSDPALHRTRVETRRAKTREGPSWAEVQARHYVSNTTPRIVLDTAVLSHGEALSQLVKTLIEDRPEPEQSG